MSQSGSSATLIPTLQQPTKLSCKAKNDLKWESFKDEVFQTYMKHDATLQATMLKIEEGHGFTASERKWKMKLKEWGFEKYVQSYDMNVMVAKADKRKLEGKATTFLHNGNKITEQRFETFKKRKLKQPEALDEMSYVSPGAATPPNVTYHTPKTDNFPAMDICDAVVTIGSWPAEDHRPHAGGSPGTRIDQFCSNVKRLQLDDAATEDIEKSENIMREPLKLPELPKKIRSEVLEDLETSDMDASLTTNASLQPDHALGIHELKANKFLPNTSRNLELPLRRPTESESTRQIGSSEVDDPFIASSEPQVDHSSKHDQCLPSLEELEFIYNSIRILKVTPDPREVESAEKQLFRAVSSSASLAPRQRNLALQHLSFLVNEGHAQFEIRTDHFSMVFAGIVTACEQNFGPEAPLTMRNRRSYIDHLMLKGDYLRAKVQIRKSLDVPLSKETLEARLQSGSSLSLCLVACGRKRKAIVTFLDSLCQYLRAGGVYSTSTQIDWELPVWYHNGVFHKGLPGYSVAKMIIGTTDKIRTACTNGFCLESKPVTIMLKAIYTAKFASAYGLNSYADSLKRELSRSNNLWYSAKSVELLIDQSRSNQQQNRLHHSADNILDAYIILEDMTISNIFLEMVDKVRDHWEGSETKLEFRSLEGASIEEQKRDALSRSKVLNIKELDDMMRMKIEKDDDSDKESADGEFSSRNTSSSSKFGVTYSEVSVAGFRSSDYVTYL